MFIAQPLLFQQFDLTQQGQQLLPLFGGTRRYGSHQQRLSKHVFQLFDALRDGGLRNTKLLRGALKPSFPDYRVQRL